MENAKQKAIEVAYGSLYEKYKEHINEGGYVRFAGKFSENYFELSNTDFEEKEQLDYYFLRPKSLSGIEKNNNWISIHSEEDLPKEEDELYFVNGNNFTIHQCIYHEGIKEYWLKNITHWQPIIKPEKPIY